jgi:hypothetical protein
MTPKQLRTASAGREYSFIFRDMTSLSGNSFRIEAASMRDAKNRVAILEREKGVKLRFDRAARLIRRNA